MTDATLIQRLNDEADLCENEGAEDVASLLWQAATRIQGLEQRLAAAEELLLYVAETAVELERHDDSYGSNIIVFRAALREDNFERVKAHNTVNSGGES